MSEQPVGPWWRDDDTGGIGFARMFAWGGLALGAGALVLAVFAPLAGDALRTVWITGFGAAAMWVALLAVPRYRTLQRPVPWVVPTAMVLGGLAIVVMIYAFIVIVAVSVGLDLPAPTHWAPPVEGAPGVGA